MKTALVMGISGGFGGHVAPALAQQGWRIKALLRDPARLPKHFQGVDAVVGDANNIDDVRRAAEGVELIVYGVNPPNYHWDGVAVPMLDVTARVAEEGGLSVVFPGNVYVFDLADGPDFDESAPLRPQTSKGEMRYAMETRLKLASERGAKIIILRMSDYIGSGGNSTWMNILLQSRRHKPRLTTTGPRDLVHSWAYLPDVANTVAELVKQQDQLDAYSVFHFKGYEMSFHDIARAIEDVTGKPVRLRHFPWFAIRLLSPFNILFRGLVEMRYLWQQKLTLNDGKLRRTLKGNVPSTPFNVALLESGLLE